MLVKSSLRRNHNLVESLLFSSDLVDRDSQENWLVPSFQRTLKWAWHGMFISFHLRVWMDHIVAKCAFTDAPTLRLSSSDCCLPGITGETLVTCNKPSNHCRMEKNRAILDGVYLYNIFVKCNEYSTGSLFFRLTELEIPISDPACP